MAHGGTDLFASHDRQKSLLHGATVLTPVFADSHFVYRRTNGRTARLWLITNKVEAILRALFITAVSASKLSRLGYRIDFRKLRHGLITMGCRRAEERSIGWRDAAVAGTWWVLRGAVRSSSPRRGSPARPGTARPAISQPTSSVQRRPEPNYCMIYFRRWLPLCRRVGSRTHPIHRPQTPPRAISHITLSVFRLYPVQRSNFVRGGVWGDGHVPATFWLNEEPRAEYTVCHIMSQVKKSPYSAAASNALAVVGHFVSSPYNIIGSDSNAWIGFNVRFQVFTQM